MGGGTRIREQNYKERQILTECRDKRGGESWGTLECVGSRGVGYVLYYIYYYIIMGIRWG